MAEFDVAIKNLNLAFQLQEHKIGSLCMYSLLSDTFTSKAMACTEAASEMLVRRKLRIMKELVQEYKLSDGVMLVASDNDLADKMSCLPRRWLDMATKESETAL